MPWTGWSVPDRYFSGCPTLIHESWQLYTCECFTDDSGVALFDENDLDARWRDYEYILRDADWDNLDYDD